jgi:hypothetical protein
MALSSLRNLDCRRPSVNEVSNPNLNEAGSSRLGNGKPNPTRKGFVVRSSGLARGPTGVIVMISFPLPEE